MALLRFDKTAPVIVVRAKIKGPNFSLGTRLALDTGATFTILPWKIIRQLGLKIDPDRLETTTTATTVETVPLVIVPKITFLGKSVRNTPCLVKDLPPESGVDGLLGLSFLHHFSLTINFKKGLLEID